MGIDSEHQAMPPDCEMIRRSRIDPEFGSYPAIGNRSSPLGGVNNIEDYSSAIRG